MCSAIVYKDWLLVVGGIGSSGDRVYSVEIMNTHTN